MSGMFFWLMAWRALNHRGQGANAGALAMLAVASSLFTALFEAGSIWAFHGYKPSEIVSVYFTLALGIPPAWKMLALGLLIALAAASRLAPEHAGGHRGARPVRPAG
jgi:sulfoxide reductase heme-binding subunit YedZ